MLFILWIFIRALGSPCAPHVNMRSFSCSVSASSENPEAAGCHTLVMTSDRFHRGDPELRTLLYTVDHCSNFSFKWQERRCSYLCATVWYPFHELFMWLASQILTETEEVPLAKRPQDFDNIVGSMMSFFKLAVSGLAFDVSWLVRGWYLFSDGNRWISEMWMAVIVSAHSGQNPRDSASSQPLMKPRKSSTVWPRTLASDIFRQIELTHQCKSLDLWPLGEYVPCKQLHCSGGLKLWAGVCHDVIVQWH